MLIWSTQASAEEWQRPSPLMQPGGCNKRAGTTAPAWLDHTIACVQSTACRVHLLARLDSADAPVLQMAHAGKPVGQRRAPAAAAPKAVKSGRWYRNRSALAPWCCVHMTCARHWSTTRGEKVRPRFILSCLTCTVAQPCCGELYRGRQNNTKLTFISNHTQPVA